MHARYPLLFLLTLAIIVPGAGCSSAPEAPVYACDPATSENACEGCVATGFGAEVSECSLNFCPPEVLKLSLRDPVEGQPGLLCASQGAGASCTGSSVSQAFEYLTEDFWLYLSFEPDLNGDYTTERLSQAFHYTYFEVRIGAPTTHSRFVYQMPSTRDLAFFDTFAVENGKLVGSFTFDMNQMVQFVESTASGCILGDVGGQCICAYEGFSFPLEVDFELTLQRPEGG